MGAIKNSGRRTALATAALCALIAGAGAQPAVQHSPTATRAIAAGTTTAVVGQEVTLNGAASISATGAPLSYHWTLTPPHGSQARLSDPNAVKPHFAIDLAGDYIARLQISDGATVAVQTTTVVSTGNVAPIAIAGPDRHIDIGQAVTLDGSASVDANGDVVSAAWRIVDAPEGSQATVSNTEALLTTFTPDMDGDYTVALSVNDGRAKSLPAYVHLSTVNARPTADAGGNRRLVPGQSVRLDATRSSDPEAAALAYRWSLLHAPASNGAPLHGGQTAFASFTPQVPGLYVVQLMVSDGQTKEAYDTFEILVDDANRGGGTDVDGDGVVDLLDNCVEVPNPTQLDTNGDGFGNACDADLDNDGFVTNFGDLGLLRLAFFSSPGSSNWNPDADFNGDNVVNFVDLGIMRQVFFGPPGPIAITFINPAGGSWHDPANWSPAVVPDIRYTARIDLAPGAVVEYNTGQSTVSGVRTTSPLVISGGKLVVNGNAQFNDTLTLRNSGSLAGANIQAPVSGGSALINVPTFTTGNLDSVTLAADVSVTFGGTLSVTDRLTFAGGSVLLESSAGGFANISMGSTADDAVLDGVGEVRFGGTAGNNRILVNGSTADRLIVGEDVTIRSETQGGELVVNLPVVMNGTVSNDVDGTNITLCANLLTATGTWSARNNAKISTAGFSFCSARFTDSAVVTANNAEIELRAGIINEGNIEISDGTLNIGGNSATDTWLNTGSVTLDDSVLELGGNYTADNIGTIEGSGELFLTGRLDAEGQSLELANLFEGIVTLGNGGFILNATLTGAPLTIPDSTTFNFDNVTLATDLAMSNLSNLNLLNDLIMDDAVVSMSTMNSSLIRTAGPSGSSFTFGGTGEFLFNSANPLSTNIFIDSVGPNNTFETGITVRSANSGGTIGNASRGLTFRGTIINDTPGTQINVLGVPLIIEGNVEASNDGDIRLTAISELGQIAGTANLSADAAELELFGDLIIDGIFTATNGATLEIGNNAVHDWVNNGTISITDATLELGGTFSTSDIGTITGNGSTLLKGFIDNAGDAFDAGALFPGDVVFAFGSSINSGSIVNTPIVLSSASERVILNDVTLATLIDVFDNATLFANEGLVMNNGTIALNSNSGSSVTQVFFGNNETMNVTGQGEILLRGASTINTNNRVNSGSNVDLVIGPGIVMRTAGAGGALVAATAGASSLNWQGTIVSNVPGRQIGITADSMIIDGSLEIGAGAVIDLPDYTLASSASVDVEIAGADPTAFGQLRGDAATLDGTLNATLTGGFSPLAGDMFEVATFSSVTGTFAVENLPNLGGGLAFSSNYLPTGLSLDVN